VPNQICTRAPLYPAAATAPPDTPLELREPFFSPVSPLACLPPASVFERRPFSHSQRSAFRREDSVSDFDSIDWYEITDKVLGNGLCGSRLDQEATLL